MARSTRRPITALAPEAETVGGVVILLIAVRLFPPHTIRELVEAAVSVSGHTDLSELLRATVKTGMQLTGARYGALGVLGEHGTLMDFVHSGIDATTAKRIGHLPRGHGVLGTLTREAATIRIDDIARHPDAVGFPDGHPEMTTFLGVPIRVGDRVFGNLYLTEKVGGFSQDDEAVVEFLAVTAGAAVSTLRLHERLRRTTLLEDRERIARDLHDSIIQDLFAVGLGLQAASGRLDQDPASVRAQLDAAIDKLDDSIASLRRFIFDLRPPIWASPSLKSRLERLLDDLSAPHEVSIGFDFDCPPDIPEGRIADHLVATVKEAVSNALRHARPDTVDVRVAHEGERVRVSVSDDGIGFDTDERSAGLGLANMGDRIDEVRGSLFIDSMPGRGTIVHASFPVAIEP